MNQANSLSAPSRFLSRRQSLAMMALVVATTTHAALVDQQKELNIAFNRDLTSAQVSSNFEQYKTNYIPGDFDAYDTASGLRYALLWQRNTDNRGWVLLRDMDSATMSTELVARKAQGFRLSDIEAYYISGVLHWAGIWVQNKEAVDSRVHRALTSASHGTTFQTNSNAGYKMVDLQVYSTASGLRYNSIWEKNTGSVEWLQLRDMTRAQYDTEVASRSAAGYDMVDFESYKNGSDYLYAAIWEKRPSLSQVVRTDRSSTQFNNYFYQYYDEGYRLVDFERYETADGVRYAGIWQENNARFRYNKKANVNTAITDYRSVNNLPGISVAIIRNGDTIYRRGFGFADVAGSKSASSFTVYPLASLSKVVGGTLAAKMEEQQALENGTAFSLNLDSQARSYLPGLPQSHSYSTAELLAHLGCIRHYPGTNTPGIANQTTHYNTANAALTSITNNPLVSPCNVGLSYNYSTHAFTIVGAVLEDVSGKSIAQLVKEELSVPYGLTSLRSQYETASLPANYFRTVPYQEQFAIGTSGQPGFNPPHAQNNPNVAISFSDNSWKVLGGGLESNTMDLARFGWKTLNGEIVSNDPENNTLDNRLWSRVIQGNQQATHGLGWDLVTQSSGRRTAQWSGGWPGTRTYLRAYRDDGLVIAIMSNRQNQRSDINADVNDLASTIETIVLGPPRASN